MKFKISYPFLIAWSLALLMTLSCYSQEQPLRQQIVKLVTNKKAEVGIAIYAVENMDTLTWHNATHYPMQSVYKFPLALAVLHQVDQGKLSLEQKIQVTQTDLHPNTWSPMREKYPNGNVTLPLSEILRYTVSESDNNGCDILFRLVGGTEKVYDYIQGLGVKDIAIRATEEEMHQSWDVQFTNRCTPFAMAQLLQAFQQKKILSPQSQGFLWKLMVETPTGPDRIKGQLPASTVVAHKTGTSDTNTQGITAAFNDAGILTLPNGKHVVVVVFVSNSKEDAKTNANIIADIARAAWDYFNNKVK